MFESLPVFYQIATLLALAAGVGLIGISLKQPLIVSYIAVGIIAGPAVLGIAEIGEPIELLAELGVAILLFLVGLKLDIGLIRSVGPVAVATGMGQILFTAAIGFWICIALGLDTLTSAYIAVALTFSSTIIVVKLMSDKGEIGSLHGRIALGFLIVQDIVVVLAMVTLSTIGIGTAERASGLNLAESALAAVAVIAGIVLFVRYAANPLVERLAHSPELLVSFAIGWAAFLAALGDYLGFSKEIDGLLAGISLASTPFREAMSTRLTSLRDFLLLFFFIVLGARLELGHLGGDLPAALILSLFVLVGNPLIVVVIMGVMGYRRRTGFLAGLTVAQISEFSLIFMAMGITLGHVDERAVGLVTIVGIVTIAVSVYMILYSHWLYDWLAPVLKPFERAVPVREIAQDPPEPMDRYDAVVFGLGRYGGAIIQLLKRQGMHVLGVDFNPAAVRRWRKEGIATLYGDITDADFIGSLSLEGVQSVVCAVPAHEAGLIKDDAHASLVQGLRAAGYRGRIAVAKHGEAEAERLAALGANVLLDPFRDAAERALEKLVAETATQNKKEIEIIDPEYQKDL